MTGMATNDPNAPPETEVPHKTLNYIPFGYHTNREINVFIFQGQGRVSSNVGRIKS